MSANVTTIEMSDFKALDFFGNLDLSRIEGRVDSENIKKLLEDLSDELHQVGEVKSDDEQPNFAQPNLVFIAGNIMNRYNAATEDISDNVMCWNIYLSFIDMFRQSEYDKIDGIEDFKTVVEGITASKYDNDVTWESLRHSVWSFDLDDFQKAPYRLAPTFVTEAISGIRESLEDEGMVEEEEIEDNDIDETPVIKDEDDDTEVDSEEEVEPEKPIEAENKEVIEIENTINDINEMILIAGYKKSSKEYKSMKKAIDDMSEMLDMLK